MRLLHLTAVGPTVSPATLEFAPRLTVVYGASEAGKSYVIEALDFMFGATRLRELPEAEGYQTMLLGIDFGADDVVTLARNMRGGRISVFEEDIRRLPDHAPVRSLGAKHRRDDADTISFYLLDRLGVANAKLRKNLRNEVVSLSFRNIAHFVLVDEERMQSRNSPVETGNYSTRTTERSALKLLLSGTDDSGLEAGEDPNAFRRVNRGQVEVLDRAIAQSRAQLDGSPDRPQVLELLARVNGAIHAASTSVASDLASRDEMVAALDLIKAECRREEARARQASALYERFSLLEQQYASDLERLRMVKDAGTLLGYFDGEACVFCGAPSQHQQRDHAIYETVQLSESVEAESTRAEALRSDLLTTLTSVRAAQVQAQERASELRTAITASNAELVAFDRRLRPAQDDLGQLIARRSELERWLGYWQRVVDLEELRGSVAREQPLSVDPVAEGAGMGTSREFSSTLRRILINWGVPGAAQADFQPDNTPDVVLEGRTRADRGKGMRSVLHAGFSVALSDFCSDRDLPHPGFVALDTPVLTYRDPDAGTRGGADSSEQEDREAREAADASADELMSATVSRAFYDYLATVHRGQALVLENQTPPRIEAEGCKLVYFTASPSHGRAGFYPALGTAGRETGRGTT